MIQQTLMQTDMEYRKIFNELQILLKNTNRSDTEEERLQMCYYFLEQKENDFSSDAH
jgi:hypothetical protein